MWTLRAIDPPDNELTFRLMPGTVKTMGRATRADFIVSAHLLSRLHCRFTVSPHGELRVEDLKSTNGTFVNGKKVNLATLNDGDKVKVGRVEFVAQHQVH